ncbi:lysogenization regulator HflD [Acidihalobacter yilgarnensis]|uniref:High frequency lysogenization protein HflD homolog n=1 Tax=Acidihalobacter yilgarnensis TaxID=2819280 RepID=A0A1D8INR8_9GAMM|nr:high frequency lysogenization protein HflD [Acidihalobacter yilgarnensis]AOU98108.1 lysogenization regulator HflD [Acidihalobacter yilgarnensis]
MEKNLRNRTLALAAVFQCAADADRLARTGTLDEGALKPLIGSLLTRDSDSLEAVYGGIANLRPGLQILKAQLDPQERVRALEIMRYAVSLLHLERRLAKHPEMLERLGKGIDGAQRQAEYFEPGHENVIAGLAGLYRETISELGPRIIVRGEQSHLANEAVASRIRVLLLAGIRAAVLWRQAGGTRLRLLFARKPMLREAERLLA